MLFFVRIFTMRLQKQIIQETHEKLGFSALKEFQDWLQEIYAGANRCLSPFWFWQNQRSGLQDNYAGCWGRSDKSRSQDSQVCASQRTGHHWLSSDESASGRFSLQRSKIYPTHNYACGRWANRWVSAIDCAPETDKRRRYCPCDREGPLILNLVIVHSLGCGKCYQSKGNASARLCLVDLSCNTSKLYCKLSIHPLSSNCDYCLLSIILSRDMVLQCMIRPTAVVISADLVAVQSDTGLAWSTYIIDSDCFRPAVLSLNLW